MSTTTHSAKIDELLASGLSYRLIAMHAACNISTIHRIRAGEIDDPRYSVGAAIDELHASLRKKCAANKTAA